MHHYYDQTGKAFVWKYWLMDIHRIVCLLIFAPIYRIKKIFVNEKYRVDGAAIMACNHRGYSDGVILFCTFWWRRIFYLVAEVAMRNGFLKALMGTLGCVRIDRNIADIETMHRCTRLLSEGRILTVFPQGAIIRSGDLEETNLKSGTILMAIQADVPIIPMYQMKRKHFFQRWRVVLGEPIHCRDYIKGKNATMKEMNFLTDLLYERMDECRRVFEEESGIIEK